jgi:hypothetical protein
MPSGRPGRPRKSAKDPQVSVDAERLRWALDVAGLGAKAAAAELWKHRRVRASHVLIVRLANGDQTQTRESIRDALATVLLGDYFLSDWLGGVGDDRTLLRAAARRLVGRAWDERRPSGGTDSEQHDPFVALLDELQPEGEAVLSLANWRRLLGDRRVSVSKADERKFITALARALEVVFNSDTPVEELDGQPEQAHAEGLRRLARFLRGPRPEKRPVS